MPHVDAVINGGIDENSVKVWLAFLNRTEALIAQELDESDATRVTIRVTRNGSGRFFCCAITEITGTEPSRNIAHRIVRDGLRALGQVYPQFHFVDTAATAEVA